jgi:hypothetical protein
LKELVNLQIHQHLTNEEVVVENIKAQSWDDFVLIRVGSDNEDEILGIQQAAMDYQVNHPSKVVVLLLKGVEVEFYGIKLEDEAIGDSSSSNSTGDPTVSQSEVSTNEEA